MPRQQLSWHKARSVSAGLKALAGAQAILLTDVSLSTLPDVPREEDYLVAFKATHLLLKATDEWIRTPKLLPLRFPAIYVVVNTFFFLRKDKQRFPEDWKEEGNLSAQVCAGAGGHGTIPISN
ncbi:hypothetical protein Efla_005612 [Eimeria flavescens]